MVITYLDHPARRQILNHLGIAKITRSRVTSSAERNRTYMTSLRDNASAQIIAAFGLKHYSLVLFELSWFLG
jgi:hypothetical protein